ncbi:hypothetical protein N7532_001437 [Penicillium argentinense]|uniref:HMG box domain-containing protein n=1 Tax=Penicillium argentinense TaxID=1131581 RepID=A0A9W9G429_9EURO|nr:uncharacterized protein N7532_001437 [Penicillium argentinense]KAJ5110902.1 hypothetical protein N7532_001437 [Penicillium argentinense]
MEAVPSQISPEMKNLPPTPEEASLPFNSKGNIPSTLDSTSDEAALHRARATEAVWENSLRHRENTRGEIMLPINVVNVIGWSNVELLRSRYELLIDRPIRSTYDAQYDIVRLIPSIGGQRPGVQLDAWAQWHISTNLSEAAQEMNLFNDNVKQKIPRPPNSFILYRRDNHRTTTAAHPNLPNTQISRIIATKWKKESDHVKAAYREKALMAKEEHLRKHPDYQYSPRRPGTRPRRCPRIHSSALSFLWTMEEGSEILAELSKKNGGSRSFWVPVTRELIEALDKLKLLRLLGPIPEAPTPHQFASIVRQTLNRDVRSVCDDQAEDLADEDQIYESADPFMGDVLDFDGPDEPPYIVKNVPGKAAMT